MQRKTTAVQKATQTLVSFRDLSIIQASESVKIRDLDQFNSDHSHQVRNVLKYVFVMIGLKDENVPTALEKEVLLNFIFSELKRFTLEDIKTAFIMAINGELTVEVRSKGKIESVVLDANHYQNFTIPYLVNILNSYDKKRLAALHLKKKEEETKQLPEKTEKRKKAFCLKISLKMDCITVLINS